MQKPEKWDKVTPERGGYESLPPGGYECVILRAKETKSKAGRPMLEIALDIATGDYAGYFQGTFERRKKFAEGKDVYWPCIYLQVTDEASLGRFKGMIMNIEASNPGYVWDWKETGLKGKKIGCLFREEEFIGGDGQVHSAVRPAFLEPIDGITARTAPAKKAILPEASSSFGKPLGDSEIPF